MNEIIVNVDQEEVTNVFIIIDENSAEAARNSAAEARAILEELRGLDISTLPKLQFTANGTATTFDLVTIAKAKAVFWNGALLDDADWSQLNNLLTLTFTPANGEIIKPI
jgi:hypothetical protein